MPTDPNSRPLLHVAEAAREIDVSPWTIRRAIHAGELAAVRVGANGNYRIHTRDLAAFLVPVEAEKRP